MATAKKTPARRKASPKVRKGSTAIKTVADPDRPRVVKTATRKAAASDPRAARVAARQRRLQDQEKAKDVRAAKKATKKTATQAGARRQPEAMPAQQLAKPGHEHELELAPRFLHRTTPAAASCRACVRSSPVAILVSAVRWQYCSHAKAPMWRYCTWTRPRTRTSPASTWSAKAAAAW
jgi:hypothetical protein